jgi:protocatechuate 3,4-dioxygenase beta subunit
VKRTHKIAAIACVLAAILGLAAYLTSASGKADSNTTVGSAPTADGDRSRATVGDRDAKPSKREEIETDKATDTDSAPGNDSSAPPPDRAELVVRTVWNDVGTSAANQTILIERQETGIIAFPIVAKTDATGECLIKNLAPGIVLAHTRDFSDTRETVELKAGARSETTILLDRGYRIVGMVVDMAGNGIADAELWAANDDANSRAESDVELHIARPGGYFAGKSGADGSFTIDRVGGYTYLTAWRTGFGFAAADTRPAWTLANVQKANRIPKPGEVQTGPRADIKIRLVLRDGPHEIRGRVLDPNGRALGGAAIHCDARGAKPLLADRSDDKMLPLFARTAADGTFRIPGLTGKECELWVRASPWITERVVRPLAAGGTTEVEIRMRAGVTLAGIVLDPEGKPLDGVQVTIDPGYSYSGKDLAWVLPNATTDSAGRYRIVGIEPGEFKVTAWREAPGGDWMATHTMSGEASQEIPWNPTLALKRR